MLKVVTLQLTATRCNTAIHCNALQQAKADVDWVDKVAAQKQEKQEKENATHCNTVQHTVTHCNTLQHTATHCNTLQQTKADADWADKVAAQKREQHEKEHATPIIDFKAKLEALAKVRLRLRLRLRLLLRLHMTCWCTAAGAGRVRMGVGV